MNDATQKLHYNPTPEAVVASLYTGTWGETDCKIVEKAEFPLADIPASLEAGDGPKSVAAYGLQKLLQDRTSDPATYGGTPAGKLKAMQAYFEIFKSGKWRDYTEGKPRGPRAPDPFLIAAIAAVRGRDPVQVLAKFMKLEKEARDALAADETIKAKVAELKAAAESTSTEDFDL